MVRILTVCLLIAPSVVFGMRSLDEADSEKTPKELVGEAFQLLSTDGSAAARRAIELLESDIEFQPKRIATLSWIAGSGLTISGEPREAMGYLDRAEATFQEYQEKSMVLWVMRDKAAAHSDLYEFEKGKAAAQRGLKLARETGASTFFRARLFNELGNNHLGAGEFSEAAKAYTQGLKLAGPRNGQLRDVLLTNMSRLLTKLSMGEDAVDTLQAVLKQAQEYGRPQSVWLPISTLGWRGHSASPRQRSRNSGWPFLSPTVAFRSKKLVPDLSLGNCCENADSIRQRRLF